MRCLDETFRTVVRRHAAWVPLVGALVACTERNVTIRQIEAGMLLSRPALPVGLVAVIEPGATTSLPDMLCSVVASGSTSSCDRDALRGAPAAVELAQRSDRVALLEAAQAAGVGTALVVRIEEDSIARAGGQALAGGTARLQGRFRLWDVETAHLVGRGRIEVRADAACMANMRPAGCGRSTSCVHDALATALGEALLGALVPSTHEEDVTIFVEWQIPASHHALRAVAADDWATAVDIAQKDVERATWAGLSSAQVRARARHNLGVALAGRGYVDAALDALTQAQHLADEPAISRELARVRRLVDAQDSLTTKDTTIRVDLCR